MSHDTSKDPRILVAQRACVLLKKSIHQKRGVHLAVGRETLNAWASSAESAVMTLMYAYQEPSELVSSEPMQEIVRGTASFEEALAPVLEGRQGSPLLQATFKWCMRTLSGLPSRMSNPGASLASGVDLMAVAVKNVARAGNLWLTRVGDGAVEYPVVTNLAAIRAGEVYAVAFLPPREVGGTVSEAMYLGDEKRAETAGAILAEHAVDAREAVSILHDELARH